MQLNLRWWSVLPLSVGVMHAHGAGLDGATPATNRPVTLQLSERFLHEDNLYRLPPGLDVTDTLLGPNASRDDFISRTAAALVANWTHGRQQLALNTQLAADRFMQNSAL